MGISNHLYILTGASRGLGAAMAERLLKPGHSLICISRSTNAGLARVADSQGAQLVQWQQDLADGPAVSRRVAALPMQRGGGRVAACQLCIKKAASAVWWCASSFIKHSIQCLPPRSTKS